MKPKPGDIVRLKESALVGPKWLCEAARGKEWLVTEIAFDLKTGESKIEAYCAEGELSIVASEEDIEVVSDLETELVCLARSIGRDNRA